MILLPCNHTFYLEPAIVNGFLYKKLMHRHIEDILIDEDKTETVPLFRTIREHRILQQPGQNGYPQFDAEAVHLKMFETRVSVTPTPTRLLPQPPSNVPELTDEFHNQTIRQFRDWKIHGSNRMDWVDHPRYLHYLFKGLIEAWKLEKRVHTEWTGALSTECPGYYADCSRRITSIAGICPHLEAFAMCCVRNPSSLHNIPHLLRMTLSSGRQALLDHEEATNNPTKSAKLSSGSVCHKNK